MSDAVPAPPENIFTDVAALEAWMEPYREVVDQVQAMFFWRNPVAMLALVVAVNLLFMLAYVLELTFIPTMFLLLALKVGIEVIVECYGSAIASRMFKPIENKDEGLYVIYPLNKVCQTIVFFTVILSDALRFLRPRGPVDFSSAKIPLAILGCTFCVVTVTGTFALNFILVNSTFILPTVLMHPYIQPAVVGLMKRMKKKRN